MAMNASDLQKKVTKSLKIIEKCFTPLDTAILVGLSGGKDSLVTYDLCERVFGRGSVVPFNLFFLPDMQVTTEMLSYAIKRFEIKKILSYPDSVFFAYYKEGNYSWESTDRLSLPTITRGKIYPYIAKTTKINKIALGIKKNDNIRMKQQVDHNRLFGGAILPVYDWSTSEILMYMRLREIEIPKQYFAGFRGVDLNDDSLLYLHKNYPKDFALMESYFPFIGAVIKQYEYYNLKVKIHKI